MRKRHFRGIVALPNLEVCRSDRFSEDMMKNWHYISTQPWDLLLKLDRAIHKDVASVAHGPDYKPSFSLTAGSKAPVGHVAITGGPPSVAAVGDL